MNFRSQALLVFCVTACLGGGTVWGMETGDENSPNSFDSCNSDFNNAQSPFENSPVSIIAPQVTNDTPSKNLRLFHGTQQADGTWKLMPIQSLETLCVASSAALMPVAVVSAKKQSFEFMQGHPVVGLMSTQDVENNKKDKERIKALEAENKKLTAENKELTAASSESQDASKQLQNMIWFQKQFARPYFFAGAITGAAVGAFGMYAINRWRGK